VSQTVQAPLAFLGIGDGGKRCGERDQRVLELAQIVQRASQRRATPLDVSVMS
jgi:hypothetical protein